MGSKPLRHDFLFKQIFATVEIAIKIATTVSQMISMLHHRVVYAFISYTFIDIEFSVVHVQLCFKSFLFINYCVAFLPAMVATN